MISQFKFKTIVASVCMAAALPAFAAGTHTGGVEGYAIGVKAPDLSKLVHIKEQLVPPPNVPKHSLTPPKAPRVVEVTLTIQEKQIEIAPGVWVWAFTYNGSVPGPMIVVHQNDYVQLTLKNPKTNVLVHNIDFHASTGALGGGQLTKVAPGQEVVLRFKAIKPGVFIYHCAPGGKMIPWHVVHGMNGAILVIPKNGLHDKNGKPLHYDRAYYVGEQDWYVPKDKDGKYKRYASPLLSYPDDRKVMDTLTPTQITFGDRVGALTGANAMKAKVGETVMIYHSSANYPAWPHLIGGHGDYVWERGNLADKPAENLESWNIAAGSAGAAMYTFKQPGTYVYLDHNLIKAVDLGALSQFHVDGKWNLDLMDQLEAPHNMKDSKKPAVHNHAAHQAAHQHAAHQHPMPKKAETAPAHKK